MTEPRMHAVVYHVHDDEVSRLMETVLAPGESVLWRHGADESQMLKGDLDALTTDLGWPALPPAARVDGTWWQRRQARREAAAQYAVAGALLHEPGLGLWDLWRRTGMRSGRVSVALAQMERDGRITSWLETSWLAPGAEPRRRLYRLARLT